VCNVDRSRQRSLHSSLEPGFSGGGCSAVVRIAYNIHGNHLVIIATPPELLPQGRQVRSSRGKGTRLAPQLPTSERAARSRAVRSKTFPFPDGQITVFKRFGRICLRGTVIIGIGRRGLFTGSHHRWDAGRSRSEVSITISHQGVGESLILRSCQVTPSNVGRDARRRRGALFIFSTILRRARLPSTNAARRIRRDNCSLI
jgi:hypothetical protein